VSAADEILSSYQHVLTDVRLVTGSKGVFDVTVDGDLVFSKHEVGRHAAPGEVLALVRDRIGADVAVYGA